MPIKVGEPMTPPLQQETPEETTDQLRKKKLKKIAYVLIAFAIILIIGIAFALPFVIQADITSSITAYNTSMGCTNLSSSKMNFAVGQLQNYYYANQLASDGNLINNSVIAYFLPSYFSIIRENYSHFSNCILNYSSNKSVRQCYELYFEGVPICSQK